MLLVLGARGKHPLSRVKNSPRRVSATPQRSICRGDAFVYLCGDALCRRLSMSIQLIVTGSSLRDPRRNPSERVELFQHADAAICRAEAEAADAGRTYRPQIEQDSDHLLEALSDGIDRDELLLHYQPKIGVHSGTVVGVEALVRWQHPIRGLLYSDTFIALAEQSGLMGRITLTVLEQALRQIRAWSEQRPNLTVAVNISASNLLDTGFPNQVSVLLDSIGVRSSQLKLEITEDVLIAESVLMTDPHRARRVLDELHRSGVGISVDDYGTGYSSLAHLRAFPVAELKLDRSFVTPSAASPRSAAIVASTIALAHSLGMVIVAEGVETHDVHELLKTSGCDVLQGFLVSRPLPPAQLTEWLDAQSRPHPRSNAAEG
jgi:EAL domain-containing protein (putative c-di-GMP-specific phosphodiesterase class I)